MQFDHGNWWNKAAKDCERLDEKAKWTTAPKASRKEIDFRSQATGVKMTMREAHRSTFWGRRPGGARKPEMSDFASHGSVSATRESGTTLRAHTWALHPVEADRQKRLRIYSRLSPEENILYSRP